MTSDRIKLEKAVVAHHDGKAAVILWCQGKAIEFDVEEHGSAEVATDYLDNPPSCGIWIWEGWLVAGIDEPDCRYKTSKWRKPTYEQWTDIMEGINPFQDDIDISNEDDKVDKVDKVEF